jgi:PAS domain S-box-containing protein
MPLLLLVSATDALAPALVPALAEQGYQLWQVREVDGLAAELAQRQPDLALVGPDPDAARLLTWCQTLRGLLPATPLVLVLGERSAPLPNLTALDMVVNDYLSLPFSPQELLARVRNNLPRPGHGRVGATLLDTDLTGARQISEGLRLNEAFLHSIYEGINVNVFIVEVLANDDFMISGVNRAHTRHTGIPSVAVEHKRIDQLADDGILRPEVASAIKARYRLCAQTGQTLEYEEQVELNGETTHWLTHLSPVRDARGKVFRLVGSSVNITERKLAEARYQQLAADTQQQYAILRGVYDSSHTAIFSTDAQGRYTSFNQAHADAIEEFVGHRPQLGQNAIDIFGDHPYRRRAQASLEKALAGQTVFEHNFFGRPEQPRYFEVIHSPIRDAQGQVTGVAMLARDLTDRKELEDHLRVRERELGEKNELLQSILDSPQGIIIFSLDVQYRYRAFTRSHQATMQAIWGVEIKVGDNMLEVIQDPDDRAKAKANFDRALGGEAFAIDEEYGDQSRQRSFWENRYAPMYSQAGQVVGLTVFVTDISQRKTSELDLKRSLELVNQQNRRLLNFSYIVSHNMRSHTSNIAGLISALQAAETEAEKEELVVYLQRASGILNDTIHHLNEVVAIQTNIHLKVESLGLRAYIAKAIEVLFEQIVGKNATVQNNVPTQIDVKCNPAYLESIVLNFLSNALKYSHPDRPPVVRFEHQYYEPGKVMLRISDNGLGMDLTKMGAKLFGMYKTFHGNPDARGIGLFISKNQIEAMGGRVEVESTLGIGSTFKIYFA